MVAAFAPPAMVGVLFVLSLLTLAGRWLPPKAVAPAVIGLCLLMVLLALAMIAAGGRAQLLGGGLTVDPLSAFFLLLPALAGLAVGCARLGQPAPVALPRFLTVTFLVIMAADARIVLLGMALFGPACAGWMMRPAQIAGVFLLAAAFAVLAMGHGSGTAFALMRTSPPDGVRAAAILVFTLFGLAPSAGWAPWSPPSAESRGMDVPAMAVSPVLALYLSIRILADLSGPVTPGWWGLPLLLAGAVYAAIGVIRALGGSTFGDILAGLGVQQGGWMLAGLGIAAVARSADLLPLATLALGGAMLHALNYTLFASLAALSAGAAAKAAGSQSLDRLGGLGLRMPVVAIGLLVAGSSLAFLPPSAGFGSSWMLLQALFGAPRLGGFALQLVVVAVVAVLALSAGFAACATIRLGGVAFLGRPRSPRAAAADDATRVERATIIGLTVLCGLSGLFPGLVLRLTGQAQSLVTAAGLDQQGGWSGVRSQTDLAGYVPLGLLLLAALAVALITILVRSSVLLSAQDVPAWEGGYASAPAWMPFGDPATQVTPAALAVTLPARLTRLPVLPRLRIRLEGEMPSFGTLHASGAVLAVAVVLLLLVAVFGPA